MLDVLTNFCKLTSHVVHVVALQWLECILSMRASEVVKWQAKFNWCRDDLKGITSSYKGKINVMIQWQLISWLHVYNLPQYEHQIHNTQFKV